MDNSDLSIGYLRAMTAERRRLVAARIAELNAEEALLALHENAMASMDALVSDQAQQIEALKKQIAEMEQHIMETPNGISVD